VPLLVVSLNGLPHCRSPRLDWVLNRSVQTPDDVKLLNWSYCFFVDRSNFSICIAIVTISRQLLLCLNAASWMSVSGCQPIIWNLTQTKLSWSGFGQSISCRSLQESYLTCSLLLTSSLPATSAVCLLGMTVTTDRSVDWRVSTVSAVSFYWLCQQKWVRRSLDSDSAAMLVHAFVTSRIDCCNAVLAAASTDKLQRELNAAVHVFRGTKKYDWVLSWLLHEQLPVHWIDVIDCVRYKLDVVMLRCLHGQTSSLQHRNMPG